MVLLLCTNAFAIVIKCKKAKTTKILKNLILFDFRTNFLNP
jgi:hypothetical protein